jgi:hypothetical protein
MDGGQKMILITVIVIILGTAQYSYLRFFQFPSAEKIRGVIESLGPSGDPDTIEKQKKLHKWGAGMIRHLNQFCSEVEEPVQIVKAKQRESAAEAIAMFNENPDAVAAMIFLTESKDGLLRKAAIKNLANMWSNDIPKTLLKTVHASDIKLKVIDESGKEQIFTDFDITAIETLSELIHRWKIEQPSRSMNAYKTLEKALEYPRVAEKAKELLEK